jgi:hypothetical protein
VLLPQLTLLQPVRPSPIPEWGGEQFSNLPALADEELRRKASGYLRGIEEMAALRGSQGILASIVAEWDGTDAHENRFGIESRLRGAERVTLDPEDLLRIESAVFLELARNLDEREIDLEASLSEVGRLEGEFRKILGEIEEGELREYVGPEDAPLTPDRVGPAYMLSSRLLNWRRLFVACAPEGLVMPVSITDEAVGEAVESGVSRSSLAVIPALHRLTPDAFLELRERLREADGAMFSFWRELERVLGGGEASQSGDARLEEQAGRLSLQIEDFLEEGDVPEKEKVELSLLSFQNSTHEALWKHSDKLGFELCEGKFPKMGPASSALLCLTSLEK